MSGFGFSPEQQRFCQEVRVFSQEVLAPAVRERAEEELASAEILRQVAERGYLAVFIPTEYGGLGKDMVTYGIAVEEISKADFYIGMLPLMTGMAFLVCVQGSEEVKAWIPPMVRGERIPCLGITEPQCGSDATAMKTRAIRDGDYYLIQGEKTSITYGMHDLCLLYAKTSPEAGARGISCFVIPLNLPGISRSLFRDMGWQAHGRTSIFLDGVRVPSSWRVGGEGKAMAMAVSQFEFLRASLGLMALAQAQESLDRAMAYAMNREVFGQPLCRFEGVSFKIAEHATLIEAARLLCYRTLWLQDQQLPNAKEAAMCKWFAPIVAVNAIHDAMLIHGQLSYRLGHLERNLRDTIGLEIGDGTAEIMKMIIARQLMGRGAASS